MPFAFYVSSIEAFRKAESSTDTVGEVEAKLHSFWHKHKRRHYSNFAQRCGRLTILVLHRAAPTPLLHVFPFRAAHHCSTPLYTSFVTIKHLALDSSIPPPKRLRSSSALSSCSAVWLPADVSIST